MTLAMQIVHLHKMNVPPQMIKQKLGITGFMLWDTLYKVKG